MDPNHTRAGHHGLRRKNPPNLMENLHACREERCGLLPALSPPRGGSGSPANHSQKNQGEGANVIHTQITNFEDANPQEVATVIDGLIQTHDPAVLVYSTHDLGQKEDTTHLIIPGQKVSGDWNGSFIYLAPSPEIREKIRGKLHSTPLATPDTDRSVIRTVVTATPTTYRRHQPTHDEKRQGGKVFVGPLSSLQ